VIASRFRRLTSLIKRRKRARRFSIPYTRDKTWKTPQYLIVNDNLRELALPDDAGTAIAFRDIFLSDVYGLERLPQSPKTIVDIGAHAGLFSLAARLHFPSAIIHAYEPNPALWSDLDRQGEIGQFTVFHEAVGFSQGKADLEFHAGTVHTRCVPSHSGEVKITAISEATRRIAFGAEVDLLKLDCEGSEWEILEDIESMSRIRRLTMEYHLGAHQTVSDLMEKLGKSGFRVEFQRADGPNYGRIWASR
jgi:FkbM family methyltransferase